YVGANAQAFKHPGVGVYAPPTPESECYAAGWSVGQLKIVAAKDLPGEIAAGRIAPTDVLVVDGLPRELPIVAGVITAQVSAPSSHVALLSQMLGIPFVYFKGAFKSEFFHELARTAETVFVSSDGETGGHCRFDVVRGYDLTAAEINYLRDLKKPAPLEIEMYDTTAQSVLPLSQLSKTDSNKVGAKAANVAQLMKLVPQNTLAKGAAVPISFYRIFLDEALLPNGAPLRAEYQAQLTRLLSGTLSASETDLALKALRDTLESATLPERLTKDLFRALEATWPKGTRVKLRSSSNVEDNPYFNGAGLYESKGACLGDDGLKKDEVSLCYKAGMPAGEKKPDPVLKALKKVWASLYTPRGFVARRYYRVQEERVGMGVLVQASYKDELSNGVAITKYATDFGGTLAFTSKITGFPGEDDSVTNPPPGKTPETVEVSGDTVIIKVPTNTLPEGRLVLGSEAAYQRLQSLLKKVHDAYAALPENKNRKLELDFEWKNTATAAGELLILKQVRPVPLSPDANGFGRKMTVAIGKRGGLLCARPPEKDRALEVMPYKVPFKAELALHAVPLEPTPKIQSPLRKLQVWNGSAFEDIPVPAEAKAEYQTWYNGANGIDSRQVQLWVPLNFFGKPHQLRWSITQDVDRHAKIQLNPVKPVAVSEVVLASGDDIYNNLGFVENASACEQDAYWGLQPGAWPQPWPYQGPAKTKHTGTGVFEGEGKLRVELTGSRLKELNGFEKTAFFQVEQATISGITTKALSIRNHYRAIYAPAHHNFSYQWAFDLLAAENLDAVSRAELEAKGARYLILERVYTNDGGDRIEGLLFGTNLKLVAKLGTVKKIKDPIGGMQFDGA
ncbi:MAG TPA: PEP/pyruvate-binding domain-containing protein, partial [Bdellovibrionales bacterium]|nr:PEP/pyruvate-binding domain-containing protein [Bdellovibrionales bacterium]